MSRESRRLAAILLIVFPTVIFGGISILTMLISNADGYTDNPLRQDLWCAGHAHAGVLLVPAGRDKRAAASIGIDQHAKLRNKRSVTLMQLVPKLVDPALARGRTEGRSSPVNASIT